MSLLEKIEVALTEAGKDPSAPTLSDLAGIDQFHVRGADAINDMIDEAGFRTGSHVVDIGCGSGGPARLLAAAVDCKITGYDMSQDAVALGNELSKRTGHGKRVGLSVADACALPAPDEVYDAGWSIHVGMFIEQKDKFYGEAHRVLKPGSPFVIFDPVLSGAKDHGYPVPWARTPENNHICTEDALLRDVEAVGFKVDRVIDRTADCADWFRARAAGAGSQPPPLGLHLVVGPEFPQMIKAAAEATLSEVIRFPEVHLIRP
ncbi:MAG: class I SAM-dependent methyltransferase [Pseudomonadota bacterium]